MKLRRIKWLDLAKGISIFLVLAGHSVTQGVNPYVSYCNKFLFILMDFIFIFAMPCFFSISGYLYKFQRVQSIKDFLILFYKKMSSFLIPYISFTLVVFIIEHLKNNTQLPFDVMGYLYEFFVTPSYIWFLYALFFIFMLTGLMDLIKINIFIQFIIYLSLLMIQLYFKWNVASFAFCGVFSFGIFFCLGELLNIYSKDIKRYIYILITLFMILTIILLAYHVHINNVNMDTNDMFMSDVIPKILSVPCMFEFYEWLSNFHNRLIIYFTNIGKYTLIIYLVHFYIIQCIGYVLFNIINIQIINYSLIVIISWLISVFICYISKHFKPLNFVFYTRKYINHYLLDK